MACNFETLACTVVETGLQAEKVLSLLMISVCPEQGQPHAKPLA